MLAHFFIRLRNLPSEAPIMPRIFRTNLFFILLGIATFLFLREIKLNLDDDEQKAYDLLDKNSDLVKISAGSSAGKEAKTERSQSRNSAVAKDYPDHGKALPNGRLAIVPAEEVSDETIWIINEPDACKDKAPTMILGVAAAVYAFERREIIRQTWGTYANTEDVKLLFFVGDNGDANVNEHLIKEAKENQDIIQENYVESYWNLTRKTVGQLKWTKEYCPGAKILAHLDDDVFIDVPKVIKALTVDQSFTSKPDWVACMWKMGGAPVRRTGKYAVTKEEYEPERYPSSCNGPCYFISDVANEKLVDESYKHNEFKLEDMYVTGVLRDENSIPIFGIPKGQFLCQHLGKKNLMHSDVVYKEETVEERMWKAWELYGPGGEKN